MEKRFDELNVPFSYDEYFSVMRLSKEEKEERIKLAEELESIFLFFLLAYAQKQQIDYVSTIRDNYIAIALEFLQMNKTPAYISDYAEKLAKEVVQTTIDHDGEEYYTSKERGMLISANEANALGNYGEYAQAVKSGKRRKTWLTEKDNKVRETHREVDGVTIGIFEPFHVGGSLMLYPKDQTYNPSAEQVMNCRCIAEYS